MKVAVSALSPELDARVDERFGRAACLLVIETETLDFENVDNTANQRALQGAGIGAAESVAGAGVEAVITGHLGPKAFRALELAGIKGYAGAGMSVREAVAAFAAGDLELLGEGESHAGMQ